MIDIVIRLLRLVYATLSSITRPVESTDTDPDQLRELLIALVFALLAAALIEVVGAYRTIIASGRQALSTVWHWLRRSRATAKTSALVAKIRSFDWERWLY